MPFDCAPEYTWRPFTIAILVAVAATGCQAKSSSQANLIVSGKNLEQIGAALNAFEDRTRAFPSHASHTADGKPGLSWRVTILPQLGLDDLYKQFNRDESWDSPHNRPLVEKMPDVYRSPRGAAAPGLTNYLAVTGDGAALGDTGRAISKFLDGTSNTIAVVEVDDAHSVEWTRPDDFVWEAAAPAKGLGWKDDPRFLALLVDGSVQLIPNTVEAKDLAAMYTIAGREVFAGITNYLAKNAYNPSPRELRGRRQHFDLLEEASKNKN